MDKSKLRTKYFLCIFLAAAMLLCACGKSDGNTDVSDTISEKPEIPGMITPYVGLNGNAIWDMKIWEGYLYIGVGDFDKNYSVNSAYRFSLADKEWEICGSIPDEQIGRFVVLDGQLAVPGMDPKDDWSLGNYYVLQNDRFVTVRDIPNGIHNFDIVDYDGKYFFGIGVNGGKYPIVAKTGDEYEEIPLVDKDNKPISTESYNEIRAYDLFTLDNSLYAFVQLDADRAVYKYNGNEFEYYSDYNSKLVYGGFAYVPILEKQILDEKLYFTTGLLYVTENMKDVQDITPKDVDYVADILKYEEKLFVLANQGDNAIILELLSDGSFDKIIEVESSLPAMSFEYDGETFYIGTGKKGMDSKVESRILMEKHEG